MRTLVRNISPTSDAGPCDAGSEADIKKPSDDLLSHPVARAVPSALEGLTTVFGMGTGVAPPLMSLGNSKDNYITFKDINYNLLFYIFKSKVVKPHGRLVSVS